MTEVLALELEPAPAPALVVAAGPEAERRFWEYFGVRIRNRNTRAAYLRAARDFLAHAVARGAPELGDVRPIHVAAWVEDLTRTRTRAAPTAKQWLAEFGLSS